jgi:hypothetical protein
MSSQKRIAAVALSVLLVLSVAGPALAVAQAEDGLTVAVSQDEAVTATVADGNGSVANASVTVSVDDENGTYDGAGTHTTDENGTVELPAPNETVNVTMTAAHDDRTGSTSATLEAANGSEEVDQPFGLEVQAFVHSLLNGSDHDESIGHQVAEFVTSNNPGSAPEHAGPPEDRGPDNETDAGPPEDRGPDNETDGGPPEDARNDDDADDADDGGDDNGGGPPEDDGGDDAEETTEPESG